MATLGCLGVASGIIWLDLMGYFAEVRPPTIPAGAGKPIHMVDLAALFGLSGLILASVAMVQSKRDDVLQLANCYELQRYGRSARYFHWTIAVLLLPLVPMGVFTTMIPTEHQCRQACYVIDLRPVWSRI